jgi:hypothetical protein
MLGIIVWAATVVPASSQPPESVSMSVPSAISFWVTDASRSTIGSPGSTSVTFSNADLRPKKKKVLRVSVQADTAGFTPPGGTSIPASKVSWRSLGAAGGTGSNGTLTSTSYTLVYQSDMLQTSGRADVEWTLAAPGTGVRAGIHQLTIRWKVESITP